MMAFTNCPCDAAAHKKIEGEPDMIGAEATNLSTLVQSVFR